VASANVYARLNRVSVVTAGSGGKNIGDIYAGTGTSTGGIPPTVYGKMEAGKNGTAMAIYTVPAGKRGSILSVFGSIVTAKTLHLELFVKEDGETFQYRFGADVIGSETRRFAVPMVVGPKSDIRLDGKTGVGTAGEAHAGMDILVSPDRST